MPPIKATHTFFKNTFFPSTIIEWNKLDSNIRCSNSYKFFRKRILEFIRPNNIFNLPNSLGLTYLTGLLVGLSHLREHKFRYNFWDSLNPICNCSSSIESTKQYLLHYLLHNFKSERQTLSQNVRQANLNCLSIYEDALTHLLLYGHNILTENRNTFLSNSVIEYITSAKHFNDLLIL